MFKGIKRTFGAPVWWEVAKSIAKIAVLVAIAWPAVAHAIASFSQTSNGSLASLAAISAGDRDRRCSATSRSAVSRSAAIDYIVQRRRLMKQLKMSRHEVQEEMKQHEGNPAVKRAIRAGRWRSAATA